MRPHEPGCAGLDFLGYTFRYDRDLHGGPHRYLNLCPSKKSLQRARHTLRAMTGPRQCFKPIPVLIAQVNTHLIGWGAYFGKGYPRAPARPVRGGRTERQWGRSVLYSTGSILWTAAAQESPSPTSGVAIIKPMKVREVVRLIEADGWRHVRTRGSHRQFNHPPKRGVVTVPGKPNDELAPGTLNSILKQTGLK